MFDSAETEIIAEMKALIDSDTVHVDHQLDFNEGHEIGEISTLSYFGSFDEVWGTGLISKNLIDVWSFDEVWGTGIISKNLIKIW